MRSRLALLLPVVLTVLLAIASMQNVFALTEIAYDDGSDVGSNSRFLLGVKFTAPWESARLVQIRVPLYPPPGGSTYTVYVTGSDHTTVIKSFTLTVAGPGWVTATVPGGGAVVPKDFFVVIGNWPNMGWDSAYDSGRSYEGGSLATLAPYGGARGDLCLHALVDPAPSSSVGGVVLPTNTLAVLAPYLTVIGLVATATVAVKKRRN